MDLSDLRVYNSPIFGRLRIVEMDGNPWYSLSDVCRSLALVSPQGVAERLDDDEKAVVSYRTSEQDVQMTVIDGVGLYNVASRPDKACAESFMHWVLYEVVPDWWRVKYQADA